MRVPLQQQLEDALRPFMPEAALTFAAAFLVEHRVQLTLTRNRATKLGDYRHPWQGRGHRITVNQTLNPYAFTVTLVHEFAHLLVWEKYQNKVLPHGSEWKKAFTWLMKPLLTEAVFPAQLLPVLHRYFESPKASSCADPDLMRALGQYTDRPEHIKLLEEVPEGSLFATLRPARVFRKLEKRRTRFLCLELKTGKHYLVHHLTEVQLPRNTE